MTFQAADASEAIFIGNNTLTSIWGTVTVGWQGVLWCFQGIVLMVGQLIGYVTINWRWVQITDGHSGFVSNGRESRRSSWWSLVTRVGWSGLLLKGGGVDRSGCTPLKSSRWRGCTGTPYRFYRGQSWLWWISSGSSRAAALAILVDECHDR